ncbi:MAG: exopolysaccharide biosynthesis protein [Pseudomonadota bacterium]
MMSAQCRRSRAAPKQTVLDTPRPHHNPVQHILERTRAAITVPVVTVEAVVKSMDVSDQPVFLLLPALILVSPLSGIPGLSSLGGLTIALIALQILLGRQTIWLPDFVLRRQVSAERLQRALARLDRAAAFVDRRSVTRAEWIFAFPGRQLALTTCLLCGLAMPFLELVPFSATTLALVVSILASALLVRDGVLAALGLGSFGLAVFIITKLATT